MINTEIVSAYAQMCLILAKRSIKSKSRISFDNGIHVIVTRMLSELGNGTARSNEVALCTEAIIKAVDNYYEFDGKTPYETIQACIVKTLTEIEETKNMQSESADILPTQ